MALKYHEQLEEGKCYIFSGGEMKPKTLRFNTTLHNCEVVFNKNTSIKPYDADDSKIPKEEYRFELVNKLEKYEKYHQMDVMVVIQSLSEPEVINMKNGGVATLRNMQVYDESGVSVNVAVWGNPKGHEHLKENNIVVLRNASVNDFRGKSLSSHQETHVQVDFPHELQRYQNLLAYYNNKEKILQPIGQQLNENIYKNSFKPRYLKSLLEIEDDAKMQFESCSEEEKKKPIYYNCMGAVTYIPRGTFYYNACHDDKCCKKMTEGADGKWTCDKCGVTYDKPKPKFIGKVRVSDHSSSIYAMFNSDKIGEKILGKNAEEFRNAIEEKESMTDSEEWLEFLKDMTMLDYYFTIMAKPEYYNGEHHIKMYIAAAERPEENFSRYMKDLARNIEAYDKMSSSAC